MTEYWQSYAPGAGRRNPRAHAISDAPRIDLEGTWAFRLNPTVEGSGDAFLAEGFDTSGWDRMPVPSHWVLEEFTPLEGGPARRMLGTPEGPLYTNTSYPIPINPPHVPFHTPTGDYRYEFVAPEGFGPAVLRFEGVDSCAKVWLNGEELGWSNGSRLPFEFDIDLREGRNILCVRVHRWSSGTYLEDQDQWWLPGIFRDVTVIARPEGAIDDFHVHADYDPGTGEGIFSVEAATPGTVSIPDLGIEIPTGRTIRIPVEPWSAETPRLYRGTLSNGAETISLAVGFRRVEIADGVFRVNGRPVKFRGVNRHEHHPDTGRTLDRETMVADILMMKRANIDSVRTSHYPPHPEFLDLCDEYGLWVIVESDLETHGFIFTGWEGNPPAEPAWFDAVIDRMRRTVERDKNHPSVVVWSMANESWTGEAFARMREWIRHRDPSRPVLYERDPSYADSDFYSTMYPSLDLLEQIGRGVEPAPEGITEVDDARRRTLPYLLVEYAHAMGNSPGYLDEYWRIMQSHDRICGGFVWEWIDHGFNAEDAHGRPFLMHGQDVDYEPNGGRYGLHGLVFADRTPTPGLGELARAYSPIAFELGHRIKVWNHRHSADTTDLAFTWHLSVDGIEVESGDLAVPPILPGESVELARPELASVNPDAWIVMEVCAALAADTPWADAGHVLAWEQEVIDEPPVPGRGAEPGDGTQVFPSPARPELIEMGIGSFDPLTGRLTRIGDLELQGPMIDVFRAPTENDRGQGDLNNLEKVWDAVGMDRMVNHLTDLTVGDGWVRSRGRTAASAHPHAIEWQMVWWRRDQGLDLDVTVDFTGPWADTPYMHHDIWLPRLGLLSILPGGYTDVQWLGRGPGESYRDSLRNARLGRFTSKIDDLQVRYPLPQENGNHVDTRDLLLTGCDLPSLRVSGAPVFDFTARRWSSHALRDARKLHDLHDSGQVYLNLDHQQLGIGVASVGPETPERYRIPRRRTTWSLGLTLE